jgi:hypothetical protein
MGVQRKRLFDSVADLTDSRTPFTELASLRASTSSCNERSESLAVRMRRQLQPPSSSFVYTNGGDIHRVVHTSSPNMTVVDDPPHKQTTLDNQV